MYTYIYKYKYKYININICVHCPPTQNTIPIVKQSRYRPHHYHQHSTAQHPQCVKGPASLNNKPTKSTVFLPPAAHDTKKKQQKEKAEASFLLCRGVLSRDAPLLRRIDFSRVSPQRNSTNKTTKKRNEDRRRKKRNQSTRSRSLRSVCCKSPKTSDRVPTCAHIR